jgi:hypothetical protein
VSFHKEELTAETKLSVAEFADLFGFPPSAVISAIARKSVALNRPFYSVQALAERWDCSPGTVYNILKTHEAQSLNLDNGGNKKTRKSKKVICAASVARIEKERTDLLVSDSEQEPLDTVKG